MFSIHNVHNKLNTETHVNYNNESLTFILSSLISKRNKEELDEKIQYVVINAYVNYKGDEFKQLLMDRLKTAYNDVENLIMSPDLYPLPYHIVNPVLDVFDYQDLFNYLKHIYRLTPPSNLAQEFDPLIESDSRGTRIQTYLKDDYIALAAISTIFKVALLPCFNLAYIKANELSVTHREYILFHLFKNHPILEVEPVLKLKGLINKLIEQTGAGTDQDAIRALERNIPKDELANFILAINIFQKLAIASLIDDNEAKNIVTKLYNYTNNKLKNTGELSKTIRPKTVLSDNESPNEGEDSYAESTRIISSLSAGDLIEMNWVVDSIDKIISQLPIKQQERTDIQLAKFASSFVKNIIPTNILPSQMVILGAIFKGIIDPRCLDYIEIDNIYNLISVAFSYLWGIDSKHIALLLTSTVDLSIADDTVQINSTVNKTRIPKELKDELNTLYPYKRVLNADTSVNLAEETINNAADEFLGRRLVMLAPEDMINEAIGGTTIHHLLTSDIKISLAEFIIKNEKLVY